MESYPRADYGRSSGFNSFQAPDSKSFKSYEKAEKSSGCVVFGGESYKEPKFKEPSFKEPKFKEPKAPQGEELQQRPLERRQQASLVTQ